MRKLEDLGDPVGRGRTADVYAWDDGKVVKLSHPWVSASTVEVEQRKTATAHALGLAAPWVGEMVEVDGRCGLILERITGPSMMEVIEADPRSHRELARRLAELHAALHDAVVPNTLPVQANVLEERISRGEELSERERADLRQRLLEMPSGDRMCHGDFHPGNVILTAREPVVLDWIDATRGSPAADVARTVLLFLGHIDGGGVPDETRAAMMAFFRTYVDRYLEVGGGDRATLERWLPMLAAARLDEGIEELREWLLEGAREGLAVY